MNTPNNPVNEGNFMEAGSVSAPLGKVLPDLQQAINGCATMQDLIELLFATDYILDETMLAAFDDRIAELEEAYTTSIYQTLKPQLKTCNNGTRTV